MRTFNLRLTDPGAENGEGETISRFTVDANDLEEAGELARQQANYTCNPQDLGIEDEDENEDDPESEPSELQYAQWEIRDIKEAAAEVFKHKRGDSIITSGLHDTDAARYALEKLEILIR